MNEEKFILLKIRRKAYNVNNPVQAKRSSGIEIPLHNLSCVAVQPTTGLRAWVLYSLPELRFACTGLSMCKTYGLFWINAFTRKSLNEFDIKKI